MNRLLLLLAVALAAAVPLGVTGYAILGNPAEIRMVSGTEYISGENGQVITRLSDRFGNPITGATCVATIIYPDKTYFLIDQALSASSIPGNYYLGFTTPSTIGLYEEDIRCTASPFGATKQFRISSSFHVSLALNIVEQIAQNQTAFQNQLLTQFNQTRQEINDSINLQVAAIRSDLASTNSSLATRIATVDAKVNSTNATLTARFRKFYSDMVNVSINTLAAFSISEP